MAGDTRPPRAYGPLSGSARTPVAVPAPPSEADASGQYSLVQPVMMTVGMMGGLVFIVVNPNPLYIFAGCIFMVAAASSAVGMAVSARRRGSRKLAVARERFVERLTEARTELVTAARWQHTTAWAVHPAPTALPASSAGSRLFERRRADGDFLDLRVGHGTVPALSAPEPRAVTGGDPVCVLLARQLAEDASTLDSMPVSVALADSRVCVVDGSGPAAAAAVRAMVAQAVTWHSPGDLRLLVAAVDEYAAQWRWTRWLPHVLDRDQPVRDLPRLLELLTPEILSREEDTTDASVTPRSRRRPHLLVVADGLVLEAAGVLGLLAQPEIRDITVLILARDPQSPRPAWSDRTLTVGADGTLAVSGSRHATADAASPVLCEALARRIAHGADTEATTLPGDDDYPAARTLPALMGLGDLRTADRARLWAPRTAARLLTTVIGVTGDGAPLELDLKESAAGGIGPHGLIVGATGSGKSELLRTIVTGLALTHPPERLSFVLADFKGGAAFAGLAALPHTAGTITNLAGDEALVDRMYQALQGEQRRRQEMLKAAGSLPSIVEYQRFAEQHPNAIAMPYQLIIVDEFTELLTARPDFAELFAGIGRLGRSLGMHLLLASQRLDEGRLRGLESHISYRIALRTFSAQDSSVVLGVADAYRLPAEPGWAYLKVGSSVFQRFRASYVSAPAVAAEPSDTRRRHDIRVLAVTGGTADGGTERAPRHASADTAQPPDAPQPGAAAQPDAAGPAIWEAAVTLLADDRRRTHQVWLPPLPARVNLSALIPHAVVDPIRGLMIPPWASADQLVVLGGVVDLPQMQRYERLLFDVGGDKGNMLVVGAPQTGKTTFVRTLITSAALVCSPDELNVYVLDFGGGLRDLEAYPHVGAVVSRGDPERLERTLRQVLDVVADREAQFAERGIQSMAQARLARGGDGPHLWWPDIILVVDTLLDLRTTAPDLEPALQQLANRGLAVGVHVVVMVARPADVRPALRDALGTRLELRLNEPADSLMDRATARTLPTDLPGRAVLGPGLHGQVALPVVVVAGGKPLGLRQVAELSRRSWHGRTAEPVRVLPHLIEEGELTRLRTTHAPGVAVGVGEPDMDLVRLDITGGADQHVLIFGDAESGNTNLLEVLLRGLTGSTLPDQAQIFVVDYRRSLLGAIAEDRISAYVGAAGAVAEVVTDVCTMLDARLPGADLTAAQLRERSWWSGPEVFVVVDDYDLVDSLMGNPLGPLADYLPQARDIGLHLVLSRRTSGAARVLFTPLVQRARDFGGCAVLLSGDPAEGPLIGGVRASPQPPGRGVLVRRRAAPVRIQVALGVQGADPDATAPGPDLPGTVMGQPERSTP